MCILISSSWSWTRFTSGSLSINAFGWGLAAVIVVEDEVAVRQGRVGVASSSSSEDSSSESASSASECCPLGICWGRVLTSGLLLTEIPESELKVS